MEKKFKVMVGDYIAYVDSLTKAHTEINWYIDHWFNDLGGMGTPTYSITDLTTGLVILRG